MTLEEYLEFNCDWLLSAVRDVPSGKDLYPVFTFQKDNASVMVPPTIEDKGLAVALFRSLIRSVGAERYAIISAAWVVGLAEHEKDAGHAIMDREGTGTVYKDRRRECYWVVVGDREKTLLAVFFVHRDYKGKIRRLERGPSPSPQAFAHGRMMDLLVEARH
jgi:hypothetical protein